jgi:hypothetical protein
MSHEIILEFTNGVSDDLHSMRLFLNPQVVGDDLAGTLPDVADQLVGVMNGLLAQCGYYEGQLLAGNIVDDPLIADSDL